MKRLSAFLNSATARKHRRDHRPRPSLFLTKLPPEIRILIYKYVFVSEFFGPDSRNQTACRRRLHVVRVKGRLGVVSCKNPDEHRFLEDKCWGEKTTSLIQPGSKANGGKNKLALLQSCKQIHLEASNILPSAVFEHTTFDFAAVDAFYYFSHTANRTHFQAIRSMILSHVHIFSNAYPFYRQNIYTLKPPAKARTTPAPVSESVPEPGSGTANNPTDNTQEKQIYLQTWTDICDIIAGISGLEELVIRAISVEGLDIMTFAAFDQMRFFAPLVSVGERLGCDTNSPNSRPLRGFVVEIPWTLGADIKDKIDGAPFHVMTGW